MASGINFTPDGVPELTRALETLDKLVTTVGKLAGTGTALESLRKVIIGVGNSGSALSELDRSIRELSGIVRGLPVELKTALGGMRTVGVDAGKALGEGVAAGAKESLTKAKSAVRQEINQLQQDYEAAVAKGWKFKPQALESGRRRGVSLFPDDRELLAEVNAETARLQAALKSMDERSAALAADQTSARKVSLARGKAHLQAFKEVGAAVTAQLVGEAASENARLQAALKAMDEASAAQTVDAAAIRRISLARGKANLAAFKEVTTAANAQLVEEAASENARLQASLKAMDEASAAQTVDAAAIRRISLARGKANLAAFKEVTTAANAQLVEEAASENARLQAALKAMDEAFAAQTVDAAAIRRISLARGKANLAAFKEVTTAANAQLVEEAASENARLQAALKVMDEASAAQTVDAAAIRRISLARGKANLAAFKEVTTAANAQLVEEASSENARLQAALKAMDERSANDKSDAAAIRKVSLARGRDRLQAFKEATKEANAQILVAAETAQNQLDAQLAMLYRRGSRQSLVATGRAEGSYSSLATGREVLPKVALPAVEVIDPAKARAATAALKLQNNELAKFAATANTAHSSARGLASGFNLLWLTWGNMMPLLIGAGLSHGFMEVVKSGSDVNHTLTLLGAMSEESSASVARLNTNLLETARSGPFGPKQVAEAMKTLSQAGQSAEEVLRSIQPTLNFSLAGDIGIAKAADTLVSVTTAFNMGAGGFSHAGDVIAKTAAASKTSVENMAGAFKMASVLNTQYGVSLVDVGVGLAALANLGIEASAAGTALRNMYVDLSGRSAGVAKVLKAQGIQMRELSSGEFPDLIKVVEKLNTKLAEKTPIAAQGLLKAIASERGGKPIVELINLFRSLDAEGQRALVNLKSRIEESYGFAAQVAINASLTAKSQLQSLGAAFSADMVQAFDELQPNILMAVNNIKQTLAGGGFKSAVQGMAATVAGLAEAVSSNIQVFLIAGGVWGASRLILMALAAAQEALAAKTLLANAALIAAGQASEVVAVGSTAAATAVSGLAKAFMAFNVILGVAIAAYTLFEFLKARSSQTKANAADAVGEDVIAKVQAETDRLNRENELLKKTGSFAQTNVLLAAEERFGAVRKQYALEQIDYETRIKDLRAYQAKVSPGGVDYRNSGADRGDDGGKMRMEQVSTARELAEWEGKLSASKVRQLEVESRLLAVSDKHLEAAKTNAKIIEETSKRKPLGLGTEGFEKPGRTAGAGKNGQLERVENFAADMLRVENDYHQRNLKLLEQAESDERRLLDAKHNALLVSEAEYQAKALDLVMRNEAARAAEADRHYNEGVNEVTGRMANLTRSPGGADVPVISAELAAGTQEYNKLSKSVQTLVDEYNKMLTALQLLGQTRDAEMQKLKEETSFRKQMAAVNFEAKISAEAKAYKDLGRELDVSLQKQRDKLDLEYRMADMTEVQRAGLQAQLAYEEQSAQAIAKRTEALQGLIDTQSALADLIEGKVQNGFTLQDEGLKELIDKYGAASEAVKKYTVLLQEMKDKASNGASLAQHIAEVGQARKETIQLRDDLAKALTDAAMKGGQGFKNTWLSIRDWLKSTFAKTVLEPQLKLFFGQMLGTNAAGSAAGSAGGSAGGSAVGSLLGSSTGSIGTTLFGSPAAYGAAIGTTSVGAGSQAAMLAAQTADFGWAGVASTAASAGSAAGTLISALSNAVPYAAAVTAVAALFNKKSTPHVGGYASADETGKTTLVTKESAGAGDYMYQIMKDIQPETQTAVESLAKSFSTVLNNTAKTFKLGGAYQVSSAFAADNDDNSRGLLKILKNATQVGTVKGNFNSDPTKGLTEYTAASVKEVKRLLSEMDLPAWAKKQLDGLSDSASLSDLATMSDNIDTIQLAFYDLQKTLAPMEGSLGELSTASSDTLYNLSVLAGGFGNLSAILSTYYKNYYSQEEQHKAGMSSLATEYAKLNVGALPQTKEAFRGVIDSFVAGGGRLKEGGEQTYLTMMQLANTFSDLNSEAVDLTKQHELEIAILRAQGNEMGAVAIERQLELAALQKTNPELVTLQKALYDLADAADFATKLESAKAGLDGVAGKFLAGPDLYSYKASRIQDTLKTGGVNVDTDQILGATRDDIAALWKSVGLEGKIAITEAYQAWEDLQTLVQQTKMDDFLRGLNTTGDELMGAYDKINPKAKNLVQAWEDTTTKIDDLRSSLNSLLDLHMGETPLETALRKLKDLITRRDDLQGVVKGNEDTIYGLKSSQVSQKGVDYLKNLEKNLWASYKASDGDPKIAAQLTRVTLDRIKLEGQVKDAAASDAAKLNEKNVQAQKDALQAQIDGYKKLKDMAKELQTYILSLKAGDLSNQSYAGRLNTSKGIFDTSIKGAMSGDATALGAVQGNAQDYLKQAQQFYGGSTKEYSDIFNAVTSSLESVIGAGAGADPMLAAAQAQLDALNNLGTTTTDTSDAQIAALEELNATFGVDVASMSASIDAQSKVLKDQLTALENLATQQAAIITQAGEAYTAMVTDLDEIAADLRGTRRTAELEAASV